MGDYDAERTVKSIVAMLGWRNVPPRETLEAEIRLLKNCREWLVDCGRILGKLGHNLSDMPAFVAELKQQAPAWHRVEDGLPPPGVTVLLRVIGEAFPVREGYWNGLRDGLVRCDVWRGTSGAKIRKVTHWTAMPQPPEV